MALSVMPCDAARHALCCAQRCARVTEVGVCAVLWVCWRMQRAGCGWRAVTYG